MAGPLGRLVSNMIAGPLTPRASRLTAQATCRASGSCATKARAIDRAAVDVGIAGEIVGHARLEANAAQLRDQPAPHRIAIYAVGGMRPFVAEDPRQPRRGAIGVALPAPPAQPMNRASRPS